MKKISKKSPEFHRLKALRSYNLLETLPEQDLGDITRLAASTCETPTSFISVVDEDKVWIHTSNGDKMSSLSREFAYCNLAIKQTEVFEITDTQKDLHCGNPNVLDTAKIRFYAAAPLVNSEGFVLGALCVVQDTPKSLRPDQKESLKALAKMVMTQFELRRTREESEENTNRYMNMIEEAGDIIYSCDLRGHFLYVNSRIKNLIGHAAEDITGKHYTSLIVDDWKKKALKFYFRQYIKKIPVTVLEFPVNTGDGQVKWVEQTVTFNFKNGKAHSFQGIVRDIDSRKHAEEQMMLVTAAKEQFMANMSHEIRTPLNAILGFAGLLANTKLTKTQADYAGAIGTSGKNLLNIINDILDFSKIEAGMMRFESMPVNLRSTFSSLLILFKEKAREKNNTLDFKAHKTIPELISTDPTRLTQIIINLVGNALKFTTKGFVKVEAELLHETNMICLKVSDSGIGIPTDKFDSIFERFHQASGDTTRKFGGSGLGLSIVKNLVELQGGQIEVESEPGEGSVFTVTLPYKKVEEKDRLLMQPDKKINPKHKTSDLSILIVEDNRFNQVLATKIIKSFGFRSEIAGNGKIAIDLIRKNKYDVVLMDMQMPVMDGYEATQIIRTQLKSMVPIIAMTAHAISDERDKCLKVGMNDYISKPFKTEHLYNRIMHLSGKKDEVVKTEIPVPKHDKKPTHALLDLSQIRKLSGNDRKFEVQVLDIFIKDTPIALQKIEEGIQEKNYPTIKISAHTLQSSVNLLGMKNKLGTVLVDIEDKAKLEEPLSIISGLFEGLNSTCNKAISEAKQLRKKLKQGF